MSNWLKNFKLKVMKSKREAYSITVQKYRLLFDKIDKQIKQIENAQ